MGKELMPQMGIIEFFDNIYSKYKRYWWRGENRYSTNPFDFNAPMRKLLEILSKRQPGSALDLGAGEGADAIRLALMGYEVDALEGSAVGAEKIKAFASQAGVHVNVIHKNVLDFQPIRRYDVVLCNGLLHYIEDKASVLKKFQNSTQTGGFNMVSVFSDYAPVPKCHQIIEVYCDAEEGIVKSLYNSSSWHHNLILLQRNRLDNSHPGFPPHRHSFIKILAQKLSE